LQVAKKLFESEKIKCFLFQNCFDTKTLSDVTIRLADQISGRSLEQDVLDLDNIVSRELNNFVDEVVKKVGFFHFCNILIFFALKGEATMWS
jgi:hypothetical protein